MAEPIVIKIGLDTGDAQRAGQRLAQQLQSGLAGQLPSAKQVGDQFTSALTPNRGLIQRALEALRLIPKEAQRVSRDTEQAFSSGLSGGVFSRLVGQARSAFSSIRSAASSILGGSGGGGGGGSNFLSTLLGTAGGEIAGGAALGIAGAIAGGVSALGGALKSVVSAGVDFNATIESAGISLKRLLGSAQAAKDEIAKLKKEATVAPVNFETLLELDQRLIAVGFSAKTTASDLTAFSQGLGLIAGTKGLDDRLGRVVTQLTQMATKGKAANEELTILAENNIPVYKILADATGKTADEIVRFAETGQLDGLKTAQLIFKEIGKSAAEAAPEIQKSFAVLSSNLGDLFQQSSGQATENIFGSLKKGLEALTGEGATGLAQTVAKGVNTITQPLTDGFNKAIDALQSGTFFNLGTQIVQGLGDGIKQTAQGAWDKAKELGQGVLDTVKGILQIQSPSKAMEELGQFAGDGFITGLIDRTSEGFKKWAKQIEDIGGEEFIKAVERVAKKVGANPNDLLGVFGFESGLNPSRVNAQSKATGLIQFLPSTAKSLGTTTADLAGQSAVDQLAFVEKYLTQFGKVLDTTEKLYSAVLRGRVLNDPETVLFTDGTKAFKQNRGLDKDASGTITLSEAASQIRKQGFTTPTGGAATIRDLVPIVTEVRGQTDKLALNLQAVATTADLIPPPFAQTSESVKSIAASTAQASAATGDLAGQTNKAADQAAVFASIWKNPLLQQIRDTKNEIAQIGENLDSKKELAQLQAIRDLKKADEDAILSQIKSRVELADATVFHAGRANAAVLGFLAKETRGVTDIVSDAQIGVIKTLFDGVDRGIEKITRRFGVFKEVFAQVLSGIARLFLSPLFAAFGGGGGAAGGGAIGGLGAAFGGLFGGGAATGGGFLTGGFAGSGGAASILGGGGGGGLGSLLGGLFGGGGLSAPGSLSLPSIARPTVFNPGLSNTPLGRIGGGGLGSILGGLGNLFKGIGFGKAPGSGGALAGALPLLGLSLGAGLGGSSLLGNLLGGAGGALLGIGLTAAPAGLAGGALGFLAPLFSNPITAIVGGALLPLAFLLGRSKQRAKDEATSGDYLQQAVDAIRELKSRAESGQVTAAQARQIFDSQILATFIQQINTIKTKSVRESRLKNQVADLRALFEKEVIPAAAAAKARGAISDKLVPEFETGGIKFGTGLALLHDREAILNVRQQANLRAIAGPNILQQIGVPDAAQSQSGTPSFATGGIFRAGAAGPMEITLDVHVGLSETDARQITVRGAQTADGQQIIVRTIQQARKNGEV